MEVSSGNTFIRRNTPQIRVDPTQGKPNWTATELFGMEDDTYEEQASNMYPEAEQSNYNQEEQYYEETQSTDEDFHRALDDLTLT